jgi:hypothetical protein
MRSLYVSSAVDRISCAGRSTRCSRRPRVQRDEGPLEISRRPDALTIARERFAEQMGRECNRLLDVARSPLPAAVEKIARETNAALTLSPSRQSRELERLERECAKAAERLAEGQTIYAQVALAAGRFADEMRAQARRRRGARATRRDWPVRRGSTRRAPRRHRPRVARLVARSGGDPPDPPPPRRLDFVCPGRSRQQKRGNALLAPARRRLQRGRHELAAHSGRVASARATRRARARTPGTLRSLGARRSRERGPGPRSVAVGRAPRAPRRLVKANDPARAPSSRRRGCCSSRRVAAPARRMSTVCAKRSRRPTCARHPPTPRGVTVSPRGVTVTRGGVI